MRTSAAGDTFRMITCPSAWPWSRACRGSTAAPLRGIAQLASLPSVTSPTGMVNLLPPSSSNAIWEAEVTPDGVTAQGNTLYAMFTASSRPTSPLRSQCQKSSEPVITVA